MKRRVEGLLRAARGDGPLFVATALLVLFGVWLRAVDLGFPKELTWDENHFVLNARNYLTHQHDWNDHPPLGKLLMVPWVWLFADESFGFRFSSLLFGLGNIVLGRALAIALYRDRHAGWLAAAFVATDGFLISYSRTALLDGVLTTFVLLVAWLAVTARSPGRVLLTAALIGCAANIKESGFGLGLPVLLVWAGRPRPVLRIAALAVAPASYAVCFSLGLFIARDHYGLSDVLRTTLKFLSDHAGARTFAHPLSSHWYTWFLPVRPLPLRYNPAGPYAVRALTTLGNLVLWWSCNVALLGGAIALLWATVFALRGRARKSRVHFGRGVRASVTLFAFAFTMLLPWIVGPQDSYIYHYLPTYTFLLVLVAGTLSRVYRRRRLPVLAFVSAVALVSAFYAPVWGQLELTPAAYRTRLFLSSWR